MAEYEERSLEDLTEEPSQYRLDELRQKGIVAQSRELNSTVALLAIMVAVYFLAGKFIADFTELMKDIFTKDISKPILGQDWRSFVDVGMRCSKLLLFTFLPIAASGLVLGFLTSISPVGFLFTTETLVPDLKRVNPISGFFRIFSIQSLIDGVKSIMRFLVLSAALYLLLKNQFYTLPSVFGFAVPQMLTYIAGSAARILGTTGILLLAFAGLDYFVQWRRFRQQARMTKSEAKKELKEREGDPQIKARIRSIQRDTARKRMMKSVPKADVVVTNPTHIAVALLYDPEESFAPKVIAKGADYLAEKIKSIAREHGIPTVENKPLARSLYKHVKVGQMIPRSLYQAVAEILAYVYKLKGKKVENKKNL